jgi:hypothetical protein
MQSDIMTSTTFVSSWERPSAYIHPLLLLHKHIPHIFETLSELCNSPIFDSSLLLSDIPMGDNAREVFSTLCRNPHLSFHQFEGLIEEAKKHVTTFEWWSVNSPHVWTLVRRILYQQCEARKFISLQKQVFPPMVVLKVEELPKYFINHICTNPDLPFDLVKYVFFDLNNGESFHPLITHDMGNQINFDFDFIDKYSSIDEWNNEELTKNPELTIDFLFKHHQKLMKYDVWRQNVTRNNGIRIEDILAIPKLPWDKSAFYFRADYKTNQWCLTSPEYKSMMQDAIIHHYKTFALGWRIDINMIQFFSDENIAIYKPMFPTKLNFVEINCLSKDVILKCFQHNLFSLEDLHHLEVLPLELLDMGYYLDENLLRHIHNVMELLNSKQYQHLVLENPKFMKTVLYNAKLDWNFVEAHFNKFEFQDISQAFSSIFYLNHSIIPWEFIFSFTNLNYDATNPKWENVKMNRLTKRKDQELGSLASVTFCLYWRMDSFTFDANIELIQNYLVSHFNISNRENKSLILYAWLILAFHQMIDFTRDFEKLQCNRRKKVNDNIFDIYRWYECNQPDHVIFSRYKDLVECILPRVLEMLRNAPIGKEIPYRISHYFGLMKECSLVIPFEFVYLTNTCHMLNEQSEIDFPKLQTMLKQTQPNDPNRHILMQTRWHAVCYHPNFIWDLLEEHEIIRKRVFETNLTRFPISLISKHPNWPWPETIIRSAFTSDMTVYLLQQAITHSPSSFIRDIFVQGKDCGIINNIIEMATGLALKDRAILSLLPPSQ